MEFKQGHFYRMRNGEPAMYWGEDDFNGDYPLCFQFEEDGCVEGRGYTLDGRFDIDEQTPWDIVEEWLDIPLELRVMFD